MSRLIDADKLNKKLTEKALAQRNTPLVELRELIHDAPTVDAVGVVRCKDCKFWTKDENVLNNRGICDEWSDFEDSIISYTKPDDYCSRGERKEQENE